MKVINGIILYVLLSGCRWIDIPTKYGSHKTVWWERHKKKWSEKEGVWKNIIMDSLSGFAWLSSERSSKYE
jgi:transposase